MSAAQPSGGPGSGRLAGHQRGPTALRIALGAQLRQLREASGISREAAGEVIGVSPAKIARIELGRVGCKQRDLTDLLTLYGASDDRELGAFLALCKQANASGWWHRYGDPLPGWFELYLGLEQAASVIRSYEVQRVPALLQTEDYARAVTRLGQRHGSQDEIDRQVNLRMSRQKLLTEPGAPSVWAVLDEAVLRRPLDGRSVLLAQIQHLIELTDLPNVTVQVLPLRVGGHAGSGPFTVLRFAESDLPDIVYLEQLTSAVYLDQPRDTESYLAVLDRLAGQAEQPDRTATLLTKVMKDV